MASTFGVDANALQEMITDIDFGMQTFRALGSQAGLARALRSDVVSGLSDSKERAAARKEAFGINELPPPEDATLWYLIKASLRDDTMMQLLIVCAIVSLILGLAVPDPYTGRVDYDEGWIEGTAILISVFIVIMVTSLNMYQKEQKFMEFNVSFQPMMFIVIRNGHRQGIKESEILVGDIFQVRMGMIVPADGVLLKGSGLKMDESAATGENDVIEKSVDHDPFLRSGSSVLEGEGFIMATCVGANSLAGRISMLCHEEKAETPLQERLTKLADNIGYMGMRAVGLLFVVLLVKELYFTLYAGTHPLSYMLFLKMVPTFIATVVVAVPEGLPLSVTIALAHSMKQMMKENNLVRHLAACETMGGATTICTDKTGTLTQNEVTVTRGFIEGKEFELNGIRAHDEKVVSWQLMHCTTKPSALLELLGESIALNSTATKKRVSVGKGQSAIRYQGNKAEQAMLLFIERFGIDPQTIRNKYPSENVHAYPFTSSKKRMTTCVRVPGALRFHVKGASKLVFEECVNMHNGTATVPITEELRAEITATINKFNLNGRGTLAIAYADIPDREGEAFAEREPKLPPLTLLGLLGIDDPIRPEVEEAVGQCKAAGITIRMVTGDEKAVAISIARKAGIYDTVSAGPAKGEEGLAMEGSYFRDLAKSEHRLNTILPRLQVLFRASPLDKQLLLDALMKRGEVVAVTGDGTGDVPALKYASIGFAMNNSTDAAKKVSDVIILDDNFCSIVTALKWGRNINDNISKFIQFQTTVSVAAVSIAFAGAVLSPWGESLLTPVQLLWLNLIMDTMAALALATEPPTDAVLERKPCRTDAPLITRRMWVNILGQAMFQIMLQLWLLNTGYEYFQVAYLSEKHLTIIFNVFVLTQVTNEFNSRILDGKLNVFSGLSRARMFLLIILVTIVVQYVCVTYAGTLMRCVPLTYKEWELCIQLALLPFPLGIVLRRIPVQEVQLPPLEEVTSEDDPYYLEQEKKAPMTFKRAAWSVVKQLKVVGAITSASSGKRSAK